MKRPWVILILWILSIYQLDHLFSDVVSENTVWDFAEIKFILFVVILVIIIDRLIIFARVCDIAVHVILEEL